MSDLELKGKVTNPVATKYYAYYGNQSKLLLMDQFFEFQLLKHVEEKVDRWKAAAAEDAREKRELRYKVLLEEFQLLHTMILTDSLDLQSLK